MRRLGIWQILYLFRNVQGVSIVPYKYEVIEIQKVRLQCHIIGINAFIDDRVTAMDDINWDIN